MAALAKIKNFVPIASTYNRVLFNAVRHKVLTKFDWMPGPYPKTEEERKKAAEKYGLHPAEYEPYPDDGLIFAGDYPRLPYKAKSLEDPNYPWDMPDEKRNYGEVIHYENRLISEDSTDIGERKEFPDWMIPTVFWGFMAVSAFLYFIADLYPNFRPVLEKQIPYSGKAYYSFESAKK